MFKVAVVGATGMVGREMLKILEERQFPVKEIFAYATSRSAGKEINFKGAKIIIKDIEQCDFKGLDLALFAGGEIASKDHVPQAVAAGCLAIDNSSSYRMENHVPLVVPQVNPQALKLHEGLIANPNCCAIPLVMTLKPLDEAAGVRKVVVTSYQSVSGTGKAAVEELLAQTRAWTLNKPLPTRVYRQQIAFNLFAEIGELKNGGYFDEEEKVIQETRKILDKPRLTVVPTCVRVPVVTGHSLSVYVELQKPLSPRRAKKIFSETPGLKLHDSPTPLEASGKDPVLVGRIRKGSGNKSLAYFCASDNLRVGAALNAVRIAERIFLDRS